MPLEWTSTVSSFVDAGFTVVAAEAVVRVDPDAAAPVPPDDFEELPQPAIASTATSGTTTPGMIFGRVRRCRISAPFRASLTSGDTHGGSNRHHDPGFSTLLPFAPTAYHSAPNSLLPSPS